ncbi:MAG: hypothetical protein NBKEAIPA_01799 [Nitrospirae bacterium]|nr:MAG: hypothetical protein UZ03_NOB001000033 [Nitrospira sp. OLB3]MBV6469891.1 hypothetical protein [Nitrospirota bacterium]MCK6492433.1 hypothetical protein [Nitrospira sp.]MEB2339696.1 hypothetical protein [Nitrospirales bacterium]MCK6498759.1 hypothetical protein [Nitrospira sp.]
MRGLRSLAMEGGTVCCLGLALAGSVTGYAYGIELQPSAAQIQATVERGRTAARDRVSPDQLHTWFGAADALAPRGFIMTKLGSLLVMANHLALRDLTPTEQDIAQVMANEQLLVSIVIYGERLNFAADSYVVLEQGGRTVKPASVRFDARGDRTAVWPQQPAYRAKVIAQFPYAELDPLAKTRLLVFPSGGGEVGFDLDFAHIE